MTDNHDLDRAERDAAAEADAAADAATDRQALLDNDEVDPGPSSAEYSVAFSPRNLAVGLAIVAGLVAFVASRRRRSRREDG